MSQKVLEQRNCFQLSASQYIRLQDKQTGIVRVVRGPTLFVPESHEHVTSEEGAIQLSKVEYLHVSNRLTGVQRTVKGPCLFFPEDNEYLSTHKTAISLKKNEYVRVVDKLSGAVKVVKGEALLFLEPVEEVVGVVERGINVDACKAVLIRKIKSGQLELITERQVFIPSEDETIVEEKKLIRLEEYHTAVIQNNDNGDKTMRHGPTTFFLQPFTKLLEQQWSTGIHKDRKDLTISLFDSRPHFMWYDFEARTRDNVELVLSVTV